MFRLSDPQEQHSTDMKVKASILMDKITTEGETVRVNTPLELLKDDNFIMWPENFVHVIDVNSPFYEYTADDFHKGNYEILITIYGISPLTGQTSEDRTSYLPCEVFWGQMFTNIIHYDDVKNSYFIDYKNFNSTVSVSMVFGGYMVKARGQNAN